MVLLPETPLRITLEHKAGSTICIPPGGPLKFLVTILHKMYLVPLSNNLVKRAHILVVVFWFWTPLFMVPRDEIWASHMQSMCKASTLLWCYHSGPSANQEMRKCDVQIVIAIMIFNYQQI